MSEWHDLLLDGKRVEDDPLALYGQFREMVPEMLHGRFDSLWKQFRKELKDCAIDRKDPKELKSWDLRRLEDGQ